MALLARDIDELHHRWFVEDLDGVVVGGDNLNLLDTTSLQQTIQSYWPELMVEFRHVLHRHLGDYCRRTPFPMPFLIAADMFTVFLSQVVKNTWPHKKRWWKNAVFILHFTSNEQIACLYEEHAALIRRKVPCN